MFEGVEVLAARLRATAPPVPAEGARESSPVLDPDGALVDRLVELERVKADADAEGMVIMAGLCDRAEGWIDWGLVEGHGPGPSDLVANEIAPALHLSPVTASIRVDQAHRIATVLPATLAVYGRGDIDRGRLLAIEDATCNLDPTAAAKVEQIVLPDAPNQTAAELRAALRRAVITVDPKVSEKRRKAAIRDRRVTRYQRTDGTSAIEAVLSALDTGEIYELVDEVARRSKTTDDIRTMDARRADALVVLLLGRDPYLGPEAPPPPTPPPGDHPREPEAPPDDPGDLGDLDSGDGPLPDDPDDLDDRFRPEPDDTDVQPRTEPDEPFRSGRALSELVARCLAAVLARQPPSPPWVSIHPVNRPDGQAVEVGELEGYGPVTSEYARWLDERGATRPPPAPSGRAPTEADARTHDPPDWLNTEIRARDGTCRYPGCRRTARRCDLDHTIPHPDGLTVAGNLAALCRRHHRAKQSGAWTVKQTDHGVLRWTSTITARTYLTHPRGHHGTWRGTTIDQA
ncbi:MAG: HNH endonuclease [Actinomycetota bacterium]|nr:HNH endonuclease [Actinomycetota bacterium]